VIWGRVVSIWRTCRLALSLALTCWLQATTLSSAAADGAGFEPFWVANFRVTQAWSGTDASVVTFGTLAQFTPLLALGPAGGRLLVINPATEGIAYVDTVDVGPVGSPSPLVLLTSANGEDRLVRTEIADTPDRWERGLMGRTSLPPDSGMLFVFPSDDTVSFWMKDTPLPLSIAFVDASGSVLSVQDMAPLSTELHSSPGPYRYALEVSQGYFANHQIGPGAHASIFFRDHDIAQGEA